jgi:hypothetical protein
MKYYLTVLIFQILFNIFKVKEIKYTYENKLKSLLLNSIWINLISLASVYFSLDRLFAGDWLVIPFYIGGSVLGKWIAMTKFENTRFRIFNFLYGNK